MKYKVIGWTYYEDYDIPFSDDTIGFAERHAIVDEIKKHGYLFSGWDHQESWLNCVPVLNDGKKRGFSQRGWGGVMAEANDEFGDYDYSIYTFHQSIKKSACRYPKTGFSPDDFVSEPLENEHFDVDVSPELFQIAQKRNPFYLEDEPSLRFLDTNDTLTLHCNGQTLTFLVGDVDRSKKQVDFRKHHLIQGKYKIVVTHKPMAKVYQRTPLMILQDEAEKVFNQCCKTYNFNTLLELFLSYGLEYVPKTKSKKVLNTLKQFVCDYTDYAFNATLVTKVLYRIDDFDFFQQIAYKALDCETNLFVNFVTYYFKKGVNMDVHIDKLLKVHKGKDIYIENLLLRAIDLHPESKTLRRRYYKCSKFYNYNGMFLLLGIGETKGLSSEHRRVLQLDNFEKLDTSTILNVAKAMSYPTYDVREDGNFCYKAPSFFDSPYQCVKDGVLKYQQYVNEKYNLSSRMEELLLVGVGKACSNPSQFLHEEEACAKYVYALDALTGFRFNLKQQAEQLFPNLKEYIEQQYKK